MAPVERRWLVLGTFAYTAGWNAFLFMNYASVSAIAKESLGGIDSASLNFSTYSMGLFTVLPLAFPFMRFINTHNYEATGVGVVCNILCAWVRYIATLSGSLALTTLSSVLMGGAAAMCICSYSLISERWFPPHRRTFATTIAVQSNYAGWLFGAVITPSAITSVATMNSFMLVQAILVSLALPLFLLFHRARPPTKATGGPDEYPGEPGAGGGGHEEAEVEMSTRDIAEKLLTDPQVLLQSLCFSLMGGISFALPAVVDEVFDPSAPAPGETTLSTQQCAWLNTAFILSGVVTGVTLGQVMKGPVAGFNKLLRGMFWAATVLLALMWLVYTGRNGMTSGVYFWLLFFILGGAGAMLLGFIGIGLQTIVAVARPVGESYSSGQVEWFIQVWGGLLPIIIALASGGGGLLLCAAMALVGAGAFHFLAKMPQDAAAVSSTLLSTDQLMAPSDL